MKKFNQLKPVEKKERSKIDAIQSLDQIHNMNKGSYAYAVYDPQPVKGKSKKFKAFDRSTPYVNTFIPIEEPKVHQPAAVTSTHDVGAINDVPAKHDAGLGHDNAVLSAIESDAPKVSVKAKKSTTKKDSSWTPGKSKKFSEDNFYLSADDGKKMGHSLFDW